MELQTLKQAAKIKAIELLVKIHKRDAKDIIGRQNELALGLKEFYENPTKELDAHNAKLKEQEDKKAAKAAAKENVERGGDKVEDEKQPEEEKQEGEETQSSDAQPQIETPGGDTTAPSEETASESEAPGDEKVYSGNEAPLAEEAPPSGT